MLKLTVRSCNFQMHPLSQIAYPPYSPATPLMGDDKKREAIRSRWLRMQSRKKKRLGISRFPTVAGLSDLEISSPHELASLAEAGEHSGAEFFRQLASRIEECREEISVHDCVRLLTMYQKLGIRNFQVFDALIPEISEDSNKLTDHEVGTLLKILSDLNIRSRPIEQRLIRRALIGLKKIHNASESRALLEGLAGMGGLPVSEISSLAIKTLKQLLSDDSQGAFKLSDLVGISRFISPTPTGVVGLLPALIAATDRSALDVAKAFSWFPEEGVLREEISRFLQEAQITVRRFAPSETDSLPALDLTAGELPRLWFTEFSEIVEKPKEETEEFSIVKSAPSPVVSTDPGTDFLKKLRHRIRGVDRVAKLSLPEIIKRNEAVELVAIAFPAIAASKSDAKQTVNLAITLLTQGAPGLQANQLIQCIEALDLSYAQLEPAQALEAVQALEYELIRKSASVPLADLRRLRKLKNIKLKKLSAFLVKDKVNVM